VYAPERAFVVKGGVYPRPNVDSAVVVLTPLAPGGAPAPRINRASVLPDPR
jgi:hypothetical protein